MLVFLASIGKGSPCPLTAGRPEQLTWTTAALTGRSRPHRHLQSAQQCNAPACQAPFSWAAKSMAWSLHAGLAMSFTLLSRAHRVFLGCLSVRVASELVSWPCSLLERHTWLGPFQQSSQSCKLGTWAEMLGYYEVIKPHPDFQSSSITWAFP